MVLTCFEEGKTILMMKIGSNSLLFKYQKCFSHLPGLLTDSPTIQWWHFLFLHASLSSLHAFHCIEGSFRNTSGQHSANGSYTYTYSEVDACSFLAVSMETDWGKGVFLCNQWSFKNHSVLPFGFERYKCMRVYACEFFFSHDVFM